MYLHKGRSFHVSKTFHIASAGGWDYIAVGPATTACMFSRHAGKYTGPGNRRFGGVIPNTTGVHGIAFVPSLVRDIPVMAG